MYIHIPIQGAFEFTSHFALSYHFFVERSQPPKPPPNTATQFLEFSQLRTKIHKSNRLLENMGKNYLNKQNDE